MTLRHIPAPRDHACAGGDPIKSKGGRVTPTRADHSSVPGQPGHLTLEEGEMWQHGHTKAIWT